MDKNHVLILIFLALITYEEIQPCVKPEHVPLPLMRCRATP
jgi:hypothetical protein